MESDIFAIMWNNEIMFPSHFPFSTIILYTSPSLDIENHNVCITESEIMFQHKTKNVYLRIHGSIYTILSEP